MGKHVGEVKWFDEKKGFGFIKRGNGEGDIFVHYSAITDKGFKVLREGETVSYDTEVTHKGTKAVNVTKV